MRISPNSNTHGGHPRCPGLKDIKTILSPHTLINNPRNREEATVKSDDNDRVKTDDEIKRAKRN